MVTMTSTEQCIGSIHRLRTNRLGEQFTATFSVVPYDGVSFGNEQMRDILGDKFGMKSVVTIMIHSNKEDYEDGGQGYQFKDELILYESDDSHILIAYKMLKGCMVSDIHARKFWNYMVRNGWEMV